MKIFALNPQNLKPAPELDIFVEYQFKKVSMIKFRQQIQEVDQSTPNTRFQKLEPRRVRREKARAAKSLKKKPSA